MSSVTALLLFWTATAWSQRSEQQTIELNPSNGYRLQSSAGPIAVTTGTLPRLRYDASWLLFGPEVSVDRDESRLGTGGSLATDRSEIAMSCNTRFPCRAAAQIVVQPSADLAVSSGGGDVSVDRFAGRLAIEATGDASVFLGPVAGVITVSTGAGDIYGYGLEAPEAEIETTGGKIDLQFSTRPQRLVIRSEEGPVTIELPDGNYGVSVKGAISTDVNVEQTSDADSQILIEARGPVRINPKNDH